MVLVLGAKYGTPWPELEGKSITEIEFLDAAKRSLPLFCFIGPSLTPEPRLVEFVRELKGKMDKKLIYEDADLTDAKKTAERIALLIKGFRWVPPAFASFAEWKNFLLAQYKRITHSAKADFPPPLVRQKDRETFRGWIKNSDPKKGTAVLSAHPGFGKTLFAYYCVRELLDEGYLTYSDVHVLPPGKELDLEAIRRIVPNPQAGSGPVLLIVDDADERGDFKALIGKLATNHEFGIGRIKVLFICQGRSVDLFYGQGYPLVSKENSADMHLSRLSLEDLKASFRVAEETLVVARKISNGIPLYLDLYFNHGFNLGTIGTHEQMEEYFLQKRLGPIMKQPGALELLKALAFTGGVALTHPFFKDVAREVGAPDDLDDSARCLIENGLIYKVGTKHRVTDRLIQDFLIAKYWTQTPDRDKIWPLLMMADEMAADILANVARAEWARAKTGADGVQFQGLWSAIEASFKASASPAERARVLGLLKEAAYFVPKLALDLAKEVRSRVELDLTKEENEAAANLAYAVGHWPAHFEDAIDILWDLGKKDGRRLNSFPSHGHRHLKELAGFRKGVSADRPQVFMVHIERWLGEGPRSGGDWAHSPIEIIDTLLGKEWQYDYYHGDKITWQRGPIPYTPERQELRAKGIALLGRCARGEFGKKIVGEALQTLRGELPLYQHGPWKGLGKFTLDELSATAEFYLGQRRPACAFVIYDMLDDLDLIFGKDGGEKLDPESKALLAKLRQAVLAGYPTEFSFMTATIRYIRAADAVTDELKRAQQAWMRLEPKVAREQLESLYEDLIALGQSPSVMMLGPARAEGWAAFGPRLYRELVANGQNIYLVGNSLMLLWDLRHEAEDDLAKRKEYLELVFPAREPTEMEKALRERGFAHWFIRGLVDSDKIRLLPEEVALIKASADRIDMDWSLIVKRLAKRDLPLAKELLLSARPGSDHKPADEACSALINSGALIESFKDDDWRAFLDILMGVDELQGYWMTQLLISLSNKRPRILTAFLQARLRKYDNLGDDTGEYRPLPLDASEHPGTAFAELDESLRKELVEEAIGLVLAGGDGRDHYYLCQYANLVAGKFLKAGLDILREMAASSDKKCVVTVADLIQYSYPNFVMDHPDIVASVLGSETLASEEEYRSVASSFAVGAGTRSSSRSIGEPSEEHVQLRKKAEAIKQSFVPGSRPYRFYEALEQDAETDLRREELRDEEILDG